MAYQWASTDPGGPIEELQRYLDAGWKVSKHRAQRARNVPRSTILLEISRDIHRQMVQADIDRAKRQIEEASKPFKGHQEGRAFPLVSPSFMVSSDYPRIPAGTLPRDVEVTIKVRASVGWQDAAACLGLSIEEYARRRLLMEPPVLGPSSRFYDDKTYEPIELSFTRED